MESTMPFAPIEEAIEAIRNGEFVLVADDEDRENEGDLILAAEKATPEKIAFLVRHTSGLICAPMLRERLEELNLPLMVSENAESFRTAFTITVDAKHGITTGISAADRALTLQVLSNPSYRAEHLRRPGHILPLQAKEGGVLKRAGHTEAAVDLIQLAGLYPAGAICEVVNEKGGMARRADLEIFSKTHNIPFVTIADLIRYRRKTEKLVKRVSSAAMPTKFGTFETYVYEGDLDGIEHVALVKGTIHANSPILVRVHSECLTGDAFGSLRCDCGEQLSMAMEQISQAGSGIIVYLRGHEGRGIGLKHKIRAYKLQENGFDTCQANEELKMPVDSREYGIGAQILADLGVKKVRLMTNNPAKYGGLEGFEIEIVERVPLVAPLVENRKSYMLTKEMKMGHSLETNEVVV